MRMTTIPQSIKKAPVTALSTAEAVTAFVLTFLVAHHLIGNVDVSSTTQSIAPFVALALPAVFGAAKWALVSPYEKVKDIVERDGLISDADFARVEALFEEKFGALVVQHAAGDEAALPDEAEFDVPAETVAASADSEPATTPAVPAGMGAGAPSADVADLAQAS